MDTTDLETEEDKRSRTKNRMTVLSFGEGEEEEDFFYIRKLNKLYRKKTSYDH